MTKPVDDLSFAELRLANLVHPHQLPEWFGPMQQVDDATLARALAELIIQADWLAADRGIDIMLAIRNCFATGERPHDDVERQRPGA